MKRVEHTDTPHVTLTPHPVDPCYIKISKVIVAQKLLQQWYHSTNFCSVMSLVELIICLPGAWKRRYSSYSFLTSSLDGVSGQRHASAPLCLGERTPDTHCTGGLVSPRAGLVTEVRGNILCPCPGPNPDRPVVQSVVRHYTD
jgi:hypothetical protein